MICINRETPYPNDKNLERVVIQADDAPALFPSSGEGVDDLPDKVQIAPGSVLYVLATSKNYVFGVDGKWHEWNGDGNAEETGGMMITFHFVNEDGTPYTVQNPETKYVVIAHSRIVETQDPGDVAVLGEIQWPDEGDATKATFITSEMPTAPDTYIVRLSEDGSSIAETGTIDNKDWDPGWYDATDPTIPDKFLFNGREIKVLHYDIFVKEA